MSKLRFLAVIMPVLATACSGENAALPVEQPLEQNAATELNFHSFEGGGLSIEMASAVNSGPSSIPDNASGNPFVATEIANASSVTDTDSDDSTVEPNISSESEPVAVNAPDAALLTTAEESSTEDLSAPTSEQGGEGDAHVAPTTEQSEVASESEKPNSLAATSVPAVVDEPVVSAALETESKEVSQEGVEFLQPSLQVSETLPDSDISPPAYKASKTETSSKLNVRRVSEPGSFNGNATHQYSKRPAWNSNETLMEIGDAAVDADSLAIVNPYMPVSTARTWSNLQPDIMYGIRFNPDPNEFAEINVRTNDYRVIRRFDAYNRCSLGNSEGTLPKNDGKIVIACDERSTGQKVLISYDIIQDKILATLNAESNYNWAGFSQSGEFIVVENNKYPDSNAHLLVYDQSFNNVRHLGGPGHGDFGYDDNGDEVYVMIRWDVIWYVRLRDGYRVELSISDSDNPIGHGHISCRNLDRPGWCYFSAEKDSRLGAVRISENDSVVEHWGFHRSSISSYQVQPKASVSRSGEQMIYTSDWFGEQDASDYVLSLP